MNKGFFSKGIKIIFGQVHWQSPTWVTLLRQHATARPGLFFTLMMSTLLLLVSMVCAYNWYQHQPKPVLVTAVITPPAITPAHKKGFVPSVLRVDFGIQQAQFIPQSVAPLHQLGKVVTDGIALSPAIDGVWAWETDHRLVFTPTVDWPAGQTYQITFAKSVFAVKTMQAYRYSFATKPLTAKIKSFGVYQDPRHPSQQHAIATVVFNYPIDPASFETNTTLSVEPLTPEDSRLDQTTYAFTVHYDRHKRKAYIQSDALTLPDVPRYLVLSLHQGVASATHSSEITTLITRSQLLPDKATYFHISAATTAIVNTEQGTPEQVLVVETSLGASEAAMNQAVHAYLLPENYPATAVEEEKKDYQWQTVGEVTPAILATATPIPLHPIVPDRAYATLHSYVFKVPPGRFIYMKIDKGTRALGDFVLTEDYVAVLNAPVYPKSIGFIHNGALLALSGEKKLSVAVRGLDAVKFDFARVLPTNVNQLVTQTEGDFNNPHFINQAFNQDNISQVFSEIQAFDASDLSKQQYTALDFSRYLSAAKNTGGPQGLFLLQATGWDPDNHVPLDVKASRLILITDLGLVVKDNNDGSHDVFVQSITRGEPVSDVPVRLLGKNGLPILSAVTDVQGRAHFVSTVDFVDEREPVAYLAMQGNDVSFMPYQQADRQLNYSRYDVGGVYNTPQEPHRLAAYLFSDRGLYRPGEPIHIGMIVKQPYAHAQPKGLPLEVIVTDPRGTTYLKKTIQLDETGYLTLDFSSDVNAPTGQYVVSLYIINDHHADSLLGSTTVRVAEFQPDRLRITSQFSDTRDGGWIAPKDLTARVQLWNLYGTPAPDRLLRSHVLLEPKPIAFSRYPTYHFGDPLREPSKASKVVKETLPDAKTNEKGVAVIDLNLNQFLNATYQLTFFTEGFEADGGRSVATQSTALVSSRPYFIGYKADGDLRYVKQHMERHVHFIAVDPRLNLLDVDKLTLEIDALQPVSTLVKQANGTYQYQSMIQHKRLSTRSIHIGTNGLDVPLPTDALGDFSVTIVDDTHTALSTFTVSVVGTGQLPLSTQAELSLKLDKAIYHAGDDIALEVTAPYTGAGLITLERDKIYAVQWFKTDTTHAIQHIRIPDDFEGNGYVNVAFVRDWNAPEVFINPLSYSIAPFSVTHTNQTMPITLQTATTARPGEVFTVDYHTEKAGKIIVFAVDEGILQAARYRTPDPLAFFFQKQALEVLTQQTVDQILPKYSFERDLSAAGGDAGEAALANHLNPFKQKSALPVVFWSGLLDTDAVARHVSFTIPDYFNGQLRVMAVAVSPDAVGSASRTADIRGDFIINPNAPSFVAPNDEFELTASVANNLKKAATVSPITMALTVSPGLEMVGAAHQTLVIPEGEERVVHFKLRATRVLGEARMTLTATQGAHASRMETVLSVRPAMPFFTQLTTGETDKVAQTFSITSAFYPEYRDVQAALSTSPLYLVKGLVRYLEHIPYGCTEQLTSKAFPLLAMAGKAWFDADTARLNARINATIQMLQARQMTSGGFGYWPGYAANSSNAFASVYAAHFLTEARLQGYRVPAEMMGAALAFLTELAAENPLDAEAAHLQAYAIYVLTCNERVTSNYLTHLLRYLDKDKTHAWEHTITGSYIAATYALLKSTDEGNRLISQYAPKQRTVDETDFDNTALSNAQYLYLVARHFPDRLTELGHARWMPLINDLNSDELNTLFAAYASLALSAYPMPVNAVQPDRFSIQYVSPNETVTTPLPFDKGYGVVAVDDAVNQLIVNNPTHQRYFYQVTQAGFETDLPKTSIQAGLEVYRDYRDEQGAVIDKIALGDEVVVHIQARALTNAYISHVAIVDLLPGGFEVVRDSVKQAGVEYVDVRDDRVVFYGGLNPEVTAISYRIKAISVGHYTVPPIIAESLYNPTQQARGVAGIIDVEVRK